MRNKTTLKYIVRRELWVNSNAFFCEVKTYRLQRVYLFFTKWVLTSTDGYASFDYFLRDKLERFDDFIMEVTK